MGRLQVPKIVRPLALKDYAEEFGQEVIHVWLNPPRELWLKYDPLVDEAGKIRKRLSDREKPLETVEAEAAVKRLGEIGGEIQAWYAEIWSQGPDEKSRWTTGEIEELISGTMKTDPALWPWLTGRTLVMILEHRNLAKKG